MKLCLSRSRQAGFTVVELLITMVILAILATIAIPKMRGYDEHAKQAKAKHAVALAYRAGVTYHINRGTFTGLDAWLPSSEPWLTVDNTSSTPGSFKPGPDADPNHLYVDVTPAGDQAGICSASQTQNTYCLQMTAEDGSTVTYRYGWGAGTVQAVYNRESDFTTWSTDGYPQQPTYESNGNGGSGNNK